MSDATANAGFRHARRVPRAEFLVYFGLIFAIAVIFHIPVWTVQALRHARLPRLTPLARAWKDAQAVTPMIFRG